MFKDLFNKIKKQVTGAPGEEQEVLDTLTSVPLPPAAPPPPDPEDLCPIVPDPEPQRPSGKHPITPELRKPVTGVAGLGQRGASDGQGIVANDVEDSIYNKRSQQVGQIEAMFGEYGTKVSSYMLSHTLIPGGAARIVMKLGERSRGRDGADVALIDMWIKKHGVEEFCKRVGLRLRDDHPSTPDPKSGGSDPEIRVRVLDKPRGPSSSQGMTPPPSNVPPGTTPVPSNIPPGATPPPSSTPPSRHPSSGSARDSGGTPAGLKRSFGAADPKSTAGQGGSHLQQVNFAPIALEKPQPKEHPSTPQPAAPPPPPAPPPPAPAKPPMRDLAGTQEPIVPEEPGSGKGAGDYLKDLLEESSRRPPKKK